MFVFFCLNLLTVAALILVFLKWDWSLKKYADAGQISLKSLIFNPMETSLSEKAMTHNRKDGMLLICCCSCAVSGFSLFRPVRTQKRSKQDRQFLVAQISDSEDEMSSESLNRSTPHQ